MKAPVKSLLVIGVHKFVPIDEKEAYRSKWARGLILNYDSGFTGSLA